MRKSLWIILAVLCVVIGAPNAHADTLTAYTINFTGTGTLPTAGSFTYNSTNPNFTSFLVTWDGFTFDLVFSATTPLVGATVPDCIGGATGPAAAFALLSACGGDQVNGGAFWLGVNNAPTGTGFDFMDQMGPQFLNDQISFVSGFIFDPTLPNPVSDKILGNWSISPVVAPVPEPSSLMLATPLLWAFVARKRIAQRLRQATRTIP